MTIDHDPTIEALTTGGVAKILGLSGDMVRKLHRQGRLVAVRLETGQRVFLKRDVLILAKARAAKKARQS